MLLLRIGFIILSLWLYEPMGYNGGAAAAVVVVL